MATDDTDAATATEHLYLHLQGLLLRVDRYLLSTGAVGADLPEPRMLDHIGGELAAVDAAIAARVAAAGGVQLPLERLRRSFKLSDGAVQLLVAAAAPGLDLRLAGRLAQANGGRAQPEVGLLVQVLSLDGQELRALLEELRPTGPLVRWRLVELGAAQKWSPEGPVLHRPVRAPDRIIDFLDGHTAFEPALFDGAATLHAPDKVAPVPATLRDSIERALFGAKPLVVAGPSLTGKTTAVAAAAAARGRATLEVDLERLALLDGPGPRLRDLERESVLQEAVLLLRHADILDDKHLELRRAVVATLSQRPEGAPKVALTTRGGDVVELLRSVPGAQIIHMELPSETEQARLWEQSLSFHAEVGRDVDIAHVVERYHLTPGDILEAGAVAAADARQRGPEATINLDDVVGAVRGRLRHRLRDIADLMSTTLTWDDLVLRGDTLDRVVELLSSIRHHKTVMEEWGFAKKLSYGRSLSALFSGPPGTGKTMVATLIAQELALELFRVDLSRVVSKWVGETEKNLGRAFDEAHNSQAVLLFDEADALFAKRTDVKSSNDRYANLEVNYLLQRLESYEGIVLLTTNNQTAIDDAFRRRLRFRIDFPAPDEEERERLWRAMLPIDAPVDDGINFAELGRRFEMTGGYIKNAVMRAAYLAAAAPEHRITDELLQHAAQLEWEDMGKLSMVTSD